MNELNTRPKRKGIWQTGDDDGIISEKSNNKIADT